MKGCGKTTIGKALSLKLKRQWIDSDALIERFYKEKYSNSLNCAKIFENTGEKKFREIEKKVISQISSQNAIISLGGSSLLDKASVQCCLATGIIIYISMNYKNWSERVTSLGMHNNQVIQNDMQSYFYERDCIYRSVSSFDVVSDNRTVLDVVDAISNLINAA